MTRTAAIIVPKGESAQELLATFAMTLKAQGVRLGGSVQRTERDAEGTITGMELIDVHSGERLIIDQKLGKEAACAINPHAMSQASVTLRQAIESGCQLLIVNKFAHLEAAGDGLADEIMLAMAEEVPVLVAVPEKYKEAWLRFCGGSCDQIAPDMALLMAWWESQP